MMMIKEHQGVFVKQLAHETEKHRERTGHSHGQQGFEVGLVVLERGPPQEGQRAAQK
jgi:hypothetical protein